MGHVVSSHRRTGSRLELRQQPPLLVVAVITAGIGDRSVFVLRKQLVPEVRRPLRLEPLMPGRRFGDLEEQLVDVPCGGRRYRRASSVSLLAICHTSASAVLGEVTPASRRRTPRSVPRTVEQVTNSLTTKPAGDGASPSPHDPK